MLFWIFLGCAEPEGAPEEVVDYDRDDDGRFDRDDCAPDDPTLWEHRVWGELLEVSDLDSACLGACSLVATDIRLESADSLEGLHCLTEVSGDLELLDLQSTDLAGLERLTRIGGALELKGGELERLSGLEALERVFTLRIAALDLDSLEGMPALRSLQILDITQGAGLEDLRGLEGLTDLRDLRLAGVSSLAGLPDVPVRDFFAYAVALESLEGLNTKALHVLHIDQANELSALGVDLSGELDRIWLRETALGSLAGLEAVERVEEQVWIEDNPSLQSLRGLDALVFAEELVLRENPALLDTQGLEALSDVGELLHIYGNPKLGDLYGLGTLDRVEGDLLIEGNEVLGDLSALHGLSHVGGALFVTGNKAVDPEEAEALLNAIGDKVQGSVTVHGYE